MTDQELSCDQRVQERLESRVEALSEIMDRMRDYNASEEDREEAREEYDNFALCFDYVEAEDGEPGYFRYQTSWGGPSDEFRFYVDLADLKPYKVEYWFLDWYDGASRRLYGTDLELLCEVYADFNECGTCQHILDNL